MSQTQYADCRYSPESGVRSPEYLLELYLVLQHNVPEQIQYHYPRYIPEPQSAVLHRLILQS